MLNTSEADALLRKVFPWGATVERPGEWKFLAVRYYALGDASVDDLIGVLFERHPGETNAIVSRADLETAVHTGELDLGDRIVRRPEAGDAALLAEPFETLIGPQSPSDSAWLARMRLHQSWWRTFRLRVPFGRGPTPGGRGVYGNMLDDGAAESGANFLSDDARAAYQARIAQNSTGVDPWRTRRNLLASQAMAFNLFGHLARNLELATGLFAAVVNDVDEVTHGEIERLSGALGDHTAFDAFFTYRRSDASNGCIAIETKLTEPFSQKAYDWAHYLAKPAFTTGSWKTADPETLGNPRWSQLWRNHLLAIAEETAHPEIGKPTLLVIHHPADPHCATNVAGYRALLTDPAQCQAFDLASVVNVLRPMMSDGSENAAWLNRFDERYLKLELSAPLTALAS